MESQNRPRTRQHGGERNRRRREVETKSSEIGKRELMLTHDLGEHDFGRRQKFQRERL